MSGDPRLEMRCSFLVSTFYLRIRVGVCGQINKDMILHATIGWSAAALWALPVDILGWTLDVARFAMDTILGIDN